MQLLQVNHNVSQGKMLKAWCLFAVLLFVCVFSIAHAAETPSTEPRPAVPEGAHLEGDIIVWDVPREAAPAGNFWSPAVVPYVFSSNVNATNQTRMTDAMQQWENIANVNFRPWQVGDLNWLFVQDSTVNSSFVGPQGGSQNVNIASWTSPRIIIHELGHALGDRHEQSRNDRNTYVTINYGNIASTCGTSGTDPCDYNFDIDANTAAWLYSPYDYDSVMHYGPTAFTTGGNTIDTDAPFDTQNIPYNNRDIGPNGQCFTDPVPAGGWEDGIGQRTHMSHWDCRMMSFIYPEANWRFVLPGRANLIFQFGTFPLPWDTLAEGIVGTPSGGTLWIDGGTYPRATINQAITLIAPKGTVVIQ